MSSSAPQGSSPPQASGSQASGLSAPDLSFLVAAYNAAPWIEAAITSALAQTEITVEVIVVDDASTDDTATRVQTIADGDRRVVLLRRARGGGPSAARNLALDRAQGTWIAILDADDLVGPTRGRDLIALARRTGSDVVADNAERFLDEEPGKSWRLLPNLRDGHELRVDLAEYLLQNRLTGGGANLGYLKPIFARSFLTRHAIRYDERIRIGEDFDLCLRCLLAGTDLIVSGRPHYRYRILAGSLSRSLTSADLHAMRAAYEPLAIGDTSDRRLRQANDAYLRSMRVLQAYVRVREGLRQRRWRGVLAGAGRLDFWFAMLHFGSRALRRRMT